MTDLYRDWLNWRIKRGVTYGRALRRLTDEIEDLEARTVAGILGPPPPSRAESLASFVNWLLFRRWPGQAGIVR